MLESSIGTFGAHTIEQQERRAAWSWRVWFGLVLGGTVALAFLMVTQRPSAAVLAWILYLCGVVAILRQPRHGIYLIILLALPSDATLLPWYPFVKNFSSRESLLFLNDAIVVSPLEVYLVLTLLFWLGRAAMQRQLAFFRGKLFWPILIFTGFVIFGLVYGVGRRGAVNVALWESRFLLYIPIVFIIVSNLIKSRAHVSHIIWCVAMGLFLEGVAGIWYVSSRLNWDLSSVQAITEHSAAVHMNIVFLLAIAVWMYKASPMKRVLIPLFIPVVLFTYLATQRRAAFVALALALVLTLAVLYRDNRKALFLLLPPASIVGLAYLAAFWNVDSALGVPVQAVKSVIAPGQLSSVDQASNLYRILENINLRFTIQSAPLLGLGFGQKFYQVIPLPDISWFVWWEYIPHNSILWLWIKMGLGGFLASLWLAGAALLQGSHLVARLRDDELRVAVLVSTLFIAMHFVFAYVDMAWDAQSATLLGVALALINATPHIAAEPIKRPRQRWPWQTPMLPTYASRVAGKAGSVRPTD